MDVLVERFQRRKIVSDKDSPMLFLSSSETPLFRHGGC